MIYFLCILFLSFLKFLPKNSFIFHLWKFSIIYKNYFYQNFFVNSIHYLIIDFNGILLLGLKVHLNHHLEKWCHLKQPIGEDYDFSRKNVSIIYYRQFKDQNIDAVALFITNRSELVKGFVSNVKYLSISVNFLFINRFFKSAHHC